MMPKASASISTASQKNVSMTYSTCARRHEGIAKGYR